MKGFGLPLAVFLGLAAGAGLAMGGQPYCGCYYPPIPQAPDMCGPGFYWANNCGMVYGPAYCPRPCYPPFQGMVPGPPPRGGPGGPGGFGAGPGGPAGSPTFPTHPYARSPRDFFMYYDKDEPSYAPGSYAPVSASVYAPSPYYSAPPVPSVQPVQPVPAVPPAPGVPPVPPAPQQPEEKP
ncbi:MAG TPA: hypothetical protein VH575_19865 [Gemmataceae bacterium]|jgi:hypothetical protein